MEYNVKRFKKIPMDHLDKLIKDLVEITLIKSFNVVRETLSRIGNLEDGVLTQHTHILHKKGKYYILNYKQLMELDGSNIVITEKDYSSTYKAIFVLKKWGIVNVLDYDNNIKIDECKDVYIDIVRLQDIKFNGIVTRKIYDL